MAENTTPSSEHVDATAQLNKKIDDIKKEIDTKKINKDEILVKFDEVINLFKSQNKGSQNPPVPNPAAPSQNIFEQVADFFGV